MSRAAGGKKFDKMNVARVYFGNWLRDYCEYPPLTAKQETADWHQELKLIPSLPQLKQSMSAQSSMSQQKLSGSSSGFSVS
jgi:hypothetical protein